jgi:hypothetical protein
MTDSLPTRQEGTITQWTLLLLVASLVIVFTPLLGLSDWRFSVVCRSRLSDVFSKYISRSVHVRRCWWGCVRSRLRNHWRFQVVDFGAPASYDLGFDGGRGDVGNYRPGRSRACYERAIW